MSKLDSIESILLGQEDKIKEVIQLINNVLIRINTIESMIKLIEDQIPNKIKDSKKLLTKQKEVLEEFWTHKVPIGYRSYEKGSLDEKIHLQEIERMKKEKLKEIVPEIIPEETD